MPKTQLAYSFSTLDMYDTCPKKLYHIKVAKDTKDEDSSYSADGKAIHDALYRRVIFGAPLPIPLRHMEKIAAKYSAIPGDKQGELKFALDDELSPVGFFDKTVQWRAIMDLLIANGNRALLVDWKTGKPKEGFAQLKLAAAVVSRHMPEIEHFTCAYVWVNHASVPPSTFTMKKEHMRAVWADNFEKVREIEKALKTTTFPATPGDPFPCKWCPVIHCPHNKKRG